MLTRCLHMLVILLAMSSGAWAAVVEETDIDIRTREIAKTLRCTVCQTESVWESAAPLALQMREAIRERVAQGQSAEEIRAYFHSRYGDYILMQPTTQGLNWLIWGGPFALLVLGGIFLYRALNRWVAESPAPAPEPLSPVDDRSRDRLDRELHRTAPR